MRQAVKAIFGLAALATIVASCATQSGRPAPTQAPSPAAPALIARAWSVEGLAQLRAAAASAVEEGLPAETEAIGALDALEQRAATDAEARARLDAAADTLFASLARAFARGAIDPSTVDPEWRFARPPEPDLAALKAAVDSGSGIVTVLRELAPAAPEYNALREELARVSAEPLEATDAAGLSRETRIERLRANLERWRWLPRSLPQRRVEVRIPFYELSVRQEDAGVETHGVIVGARGTPTPSFAAEIVSVTLNPYWTPPSSIAEGELLPRFRRDPDAARREGFEVVDSAGAVIDWTAIDWRARPFPYALRQRPGVGNPLGQLRFDLPNPYAVYVHDTPNRDLFAREARAFSHGCIRVERPVELAASVLNAPEWTQDEIDAAISAGKTQAVFLAAPMPIYVLYMTAVADADGAFVYADDIYGLDRALVRASDGATGEQRTALASAASQFCRG